MEKNEKIVAKCLLLAKQNPFLFDKDDISAKTNFSIGFKDLS
jgi:hypothetical protein